MTVDHIVALSGNCCDVARHAFCCTDNATSEGRNHEEKLKSGDGEMTADNEKRSVGGWRIVGLLISLCSALVRLNRHFAA